MLFYFHKVDFAYTLADDKAKLIKNSFSAAFKSQITHFFRNPERKVRIFVQAEPGFGFSFRIVPDGSIVFRVFSYGLQLSQIGGYGFAFNNVYRSDAVYDRTMATCTVVFETKDTLSFRSDSYHFESHAFADGRQVQHIPVCGEKRQAMCFRKTVDTGGRVVCPFQQYGEVMGIFFGKFSEYFFFLLFLYGAAVWSENGIIFFKSFHRECVVTDYAQFI